MQVDVLLGNWEAALTRATKRICHAASIDQAILGEAVKVGPGMRMTKPLLSGTSIDLGMHTASGSGTRQHVAFCCNTHPIPVRVVTFR